MADVFCKIIAGEIPAEIVYRDEAVIVMKDINPKVPVHMLVIPVAHVDSLEDASEALIGTLIKTAHVVAGQLGLADKGYRLIMNHGVDGGKIVPHLHFHLLGGKNLGPKIVQE